MSTELKQYQFTYVRQSDGVTDYLTLLCADAKQALKSFFDGDPDCQKHFMAMEFRGSVQIEVTPATKDRHGLRVVK
jgi:hypothetical protein